MELFGHGEHCQKDAKPLKLKEVTFLTNSPKILREISKFMLEAATLLEKKIDFDHLHLQDESKYWKKNWEAGWPDVIVFKDKKIKKLTTVKKKTKKKV